VEIVRRFTRTMYLFGASSSLALHLIGCTEQGTTGLEKVKLDISNRPDLTAVIETQLVVYGAEGRVEHEYNHSQTVAGKFDGSGIARPVARLRSFAVDSTSGTPVLITYLAVPATGELAYSYDQTTIDSLGRTIRMVATGPSDGSPVTDSYGYVNGALATWDHSSWAPASGGYLLKSQALNSYTNGALMATVFTNISTTPVPTQTLTSRNFRAHLAALSGRAIDKVACALAPNSAFGATPCLHEGLVFAGETIVLGGATVLGAPSGGTAVAVWTGAYFVGWGLWTDAMYGFLHCINSGGGGKPRGTKLVPQ
jgi:hypothetical protein